MTKPITGGVENGGTAEADFSFYRGPVGTRSRQGSDVVEVAYRGSVTNIRLPVPGRLDDRAVEVLSIARSLIDRKLVVVTVRPSNI